MHTGNLELFPIEEKDDMEDYIFINDYIEFDPTDGRFILSYMAQNVLYREKEIIYREKEIIRSYRGCVEWGNDFFCQLLDLYSGGSKYNRALGTVDHKVSIEQAYKNGHKEELVNWIKRHKNDEWFVRAAAMLANIFRDVPRQ